MSSGALAVYLVGSALHVFLGWWKRASLKMPANELTWWLDRLVSSGKWLVRLWLMLASVAAYTLISPMGKYPAVTVMPAWVTGSWLDMTNAAIGQAATSGLINAIVLFVIVGMIRDRIDTQFSAIYARRKKITDTLTPFQHIVSRLVHEGVFAIRLLCLLYSSFCVVWLSDMGGTMPGGMWDAFWASVSSSGMSGSLALFVAALVAWDMLGTWQGDAPKGARIVARVVPWLAALYVGYSGIEYLSTLSNDDNPVPVLSGAFARLQAGASVPIETAPSMWNVLASLIVMLVWTVIVLTVVALVVAIYASGSDGGGGAVAGASGGGGGGFSFSSGSGTETIRDRYGNVLARREAPGITGESRVTDRWGNTIGHAYEGIGGDTHVRMKDGSKVTVRDGAFGGDRVVSKDGENIGRSGKGIGGDTVFRK